MISFRSGRLAQYWIQAIFFSLGSLVCLQPSYAQVIAKPQTVKLSDEFDRSVVGGAGEFVCFTHKNSKFISVFDVRNTRIATTIPLFDHQVFCVTQDDVIVFDNKNRKIDRWSLNLREQTESKEYPPGLTEVVNATSGSHSAGFVWIFCNIEGEKLQCRFLDSASLTLSELKPLDEPGNLTITSAKKGMYASADGRVVFHEPSNLLTRQNGIARIRPTPEETTYPSSTGRFLFSYRNGVFLGDDAINKLSSKQKKFLATPVVGMDAYLLLKDRPRDSRKLPLYRQVSPRLIDFNTLYWQASFPDIRILIPRDIGFGLSWLQQRVIYVPALESLVVVHPDGITLECYRVDLDAQLAERNTPRLFVVSQPKNYVLRGEKFEYQIKAASQNKERRYRIVSGPESMQVSETGLVTWDPKNGHSVNHATVQVLDGNNASAFQHLEIQVADKKPNASPSEETIVRSIPGTMSAGSSDVDPRYEFQLSGGLGSSIIRLPGPYDDFSYGGNGKYVCLCHKNSRLISILDMSTRELVEIIPLADAETAFCSNLENLFTFDHARKTIRTFNLSDGALVSERPFKQEGVLLYAVAGNNTNDRLLIAVGRPKESGMETELVAVDIATLRTKTLELKGKGKTWDNSKFGVQLAPKIWAANDGANFILSDLTHVQLSRSLKAVTMPIELKEDVQGQIRFSRVSYSGKNIITHRFVYDKRMERLDDKVIGDMFAPSMSDDSLLKARRSEFDRATKYTTRVFTLTRMGRNSLINSEEKIRIPMDAIGPEGFMGVNFNPMFYSPSAGSIVSTCRGHDHLIAVPFDAKPSAPAPAMAKLVVKSKPPTSRLKVGETFLYKIQIDASTRSPVFKLESAPEGMTISKSGTIRWRPTPKSPQKTKVEVVVIGADKQSLIYSIELEVEGVSPGAGSGLAKKPPSKAPTKKMERNKNTGSLQSRATFLQQEQMLMRSLATLKKQIEAEKKIHGFPMRLWLDRNRTKSIRARFKSLEDSKAILIDESGASIRISLENLSAFDARTAIENQLLVDELGEELKSGKLTNEQLVELRKKPSSLSETVPSYRIRYRILELIRLIKNANVDNDFAKIFHP